MKWRVLVLLSATELLGMALWFSATAVVPLLTVEWALDDAGRAWLTMSVQIGFVVGTLCSALLNIPDLLNARRLIAASALLGAAFNAAIALYADSLAPALVLRFLTGVCLAGVYPPGMKLMATWFKRGRGAAIGALVGALTIGYATPHLLSIGGFSGWRQMMLAASAGSVTAGLICLIFVTEGPYRSTGAVFNWRYVASALSDRGVRLANFGYLGHQWELYAVWTWMAPFLGASFSEYSPDIDHTWAAAATFVAIAVGAIGCVAGGLLADRYGRTAVTIVSMVVSGACCLVVGRFYGANPVWLFGICVVWGFFIVSDSAQFSASITELANPQYVGTALTLQTCVGFLLTLGSIRLMPQAVEWLTWRWAFAVLAVGPIFGVWSMARLRGSPDATKIGGERRPSVRDPR